MKFVLYSDLDEADNWIYSIRECLSTEECLSGPFTNVVTEISSFTIHSDYVFDDLESALAKKRLLESTRNFPTLKGEFSE